MMFKNINTKKSAQEKLLSDDKQRLHRMDEKQPNVI